MRALLALFVALTAAPLLTAATFILNPSFEVNYNDSWPHYGPIDSWNAAGGTGINQADGPFHNGGIQVPDRGRVAFFQGASSVHQTITGLTPGSQYWIQFFYDARNCCGGTIDLITKWNDIQVDKITNIKPIPQIPNRNNFYFRNVLITAESDTAELKFEAVAAGDASALLDAVTIVQRDEGNVPLMNPSFEASGTLDFPGYINPANIAGWAGTGGYGVNVSGVGPFADNGTNPDQDNVAFIQGPGSLSQRVDSLTVGSKYDLSFAYNARGGNAPRLRIKVGDQILAEIDVASVDAATPYRTRTVDFTAADSAAVITFEQLAEGDNTVLLDDIRLAGQVSPPLPCLGIAPAAAELAPGQIATITVTVPDQLLAKGPATIQLRSPNTAVAILVGANNDGILALDFVAGMPTSRTFDIQAVARGTTRLEVVDAAGLCLDNDVSVAVVTSFVRNASFESSAVPPGVGYGPILAWEGGSGLNDGNGPFHDNGTIPDRRQIAFLQGSRSLSQQIFGITPGKSYWLQFRYNVRNCCGGTMDLKVKFDGVELIDLPQITAGGAAGYYFQNIGFVAAHSSALLEFVSTAVDDATLLLDAVSIVERGAGEVVIENPSFESTGIPSGVGYIQPFKFSGWESGGGGWGPNIDRVGPFSDNGDAPDQDLVAFLQTSGCYISQNITGLNAGEQYTLIFAVNARNCCGPEATHYLATFGGETLADEDIAPVGGANPYVVKYLPFVPVDAEGVLRFQHASPAGDHTLLLDNIRIVRGLASPPVSLQIGFAPNQTVRLSWPAAEVEYSLQSAPSVSGKWVGSTLPVGIEGDEFVVYDSAGPGKRFYRLSK